jgi:hypothetical protein
VSGYFGWRYEGVIRGGEDSRDLVLVRVDRGVVDGMELESGGRRYRLRLEEVPGDVAHVLRIEWEGE